LQTGSGKTFTVSSFYIMCLRLPCLFTATLTHSYP